MLYPFKLQKCDLLARGQLKMGSNVETQSHLAFSWTWSFYRRAYIAYKRMRNSTCSRNNRIITQWWKMHIGVDRTCTVSEKCVMNINLLKGAEQRRRENDAGDATVARRCWLDVPKALLRQTQLCRRRRRVNGVESSCTATASVVAFGTRQPPAVTTPASHATWIKITVDCAEARFHITDTHFAL